MIIRGILVIFLAFLAICGKPSRISFAQNEVPRSRRVVSRDTYNKVLDIAFPRESLSKEKTIFGFVLRFKSDTVPESQIIVRRNIEKIEVTESISLENKSIFAKLNDFLACGGEEDAIEMAKTIRVKSRMVNVSKAQILRWHEAFFDSFAASSKILRQQGQEFDKTNGSESIFLHGAFYEIWYEQRLNNLFFGFYDTDIRDESIESGFKLVQWMKTVRRDVGKLK